MKILIQIHFNFINFNFKSNSPKKLTIGFITSYYYQNPIVFNVSGLSNVHSEISFLLSNHNYYDNLFFLVGSVNNIDFLHLNGTKFESSSPIVLAVYRFDSMNHIGILTADQISNSDILIDYFSDFYYYSYPVYVYIFENRSLNLHISSFPYQTYIYSRFPETKLEISSIIEIPNSEYLPSLILHNISLFVPPCTLR